MYKDYNMTQLTLPLETSVLIPTNDMSRHVNDIVETIPKTEFDEFRHHRGATSYHPKMMLKVILYAYTQSVFSGRKIEKLLNDSSGYHKIKSLLIKRLIDLESIQK